MKKDETPDAARRKFDRMLEVGAWTGPGAAPEPRTEDAPWWWDGDEQASSSFLASMGVNLT